MAKVLLGVTGSVAAVKVPLLASLLREAGYEVKVAVTAAAEYFLRAADLPEPPLRDADEWPRRSAAEPADRVYSRGDAVPHIELRRWADLLLVAPLDANTLAKMSAGLSDNLLTCVYRAWDFARPIVLAPAMNTLMWESPLTRRHLRQLLADHSAEPGPPVGATNEELIAAINAGCRRLRIVGPISKTLACGDVGIGAMAEPADIVREVREMTAGA
jgi:phosphopantothenoylcysteine decarboxylase